VDPNARLERVTTVDGRILLDREKGMEISPDTTFSVVTLDFLAAGGGGFADLRELNVSETLGISRELIANSLELSKQTLMNATDGRMTNVNAGEKAKERD
jgi:hypothetical protein